MKFVESHGKVPCLREEDEKKNIETAFNFSRNRHKHAFYALNAGKYIT